MIKFGLVQKKKEKKKSGFKFREETKEKNKAKKTVKDNAFF